MKRTSFRCDGMARCTARDTARVTLAVYQKGVRSLFGVVLGLWLLAFVPSGYANSDVLDASDSVLRVWVGLPLPGDLSANDKAVIQQRGFITDGRQVVFTHQGQYYALKGSGSSFALTANILATNHHVVADIVIRQGVGFLVSEKGGALSLTPFDVIWHDGKRDLALIRSASLNLAPMSFSHADSIYKSASVWSIGFPGASDEVLGGLNDFTGYFEPKIRLGNLASPRDKGGVSVWEHNADISSGNSGGPLVNACGEVVGVNTFGHKTNNSVLFAVAGHELFDALNDLGVGYNTAALKCVSTPGWLMPLVVAVGVLMLAILAFLWNLKQQIKQGTYQKSNSKLVDSIAQKLGSKEVKVEQEHQWQEHENGRLYRYDDVYGIIWKDELSDPAPEPPPTPEPEPELSERFVVSAYVAGRIVAQQCLQPDVHFSIGRSAGNDLVIPSDFVSGRHLALQLSCRRPMPGRRNAGVSLQLEDLKSTNGTFVDGKPVLGAVGLSGQERITLADQAVVLSIDYPQWVLDLWGRIDTPPQPLKQDAIAVLEALSPGLPNLRIETGQWISLGRSSANPYVIPSEYVSEQHCVLSLEADGQLVVLDSGSTNGTYVDDTNNRISKAQLDIGQVLYLVDESFGFRRTE